MQHCDTYIQSNNYLFASSFIGFDFVKSDVTVSESDWIYRVAFNDSEGNSADDSFEILVLAGDEGLTIDGEGYCTPEGVPFEGVVDFIESEYEYYSE